MGTKFSDTHPYTFSAFCESYKKFLVPHFQRAFAWKSKQINELWESMITNENEYFIGNVVCLTASEESDDRVVIIDGQQRLFTISLLLSVIKDECCSLSSKTKKEQEQIERIKDAISRFLFYQDLLHPLDMRVRLLHTKSNLKEIYEKLLKREIDVYNRKVINELDDNQIKYVRNYKTIHRLVKQYIKGKELEKLIELLEKTSSLTFIVITCNSDNDAYHIFEGLNATGIGLSVADLVKNAVLQKVKSRSAKNIVEDNWNEIESIFEETRISLFPKFLRHQWISREGYISTGKLYDSIKRNKLYKRESSEIIDYTKEILKDAKVYSSFRFEPKENYLLENKKIDKGIVNVIKRFRYLDIEQVFELLLAYYNKFIATDKYTKKQLCFHLEVLWTFCFRAKIIDINPSEYEKKFADHCKFINYFKKKEMDRMSVNFYKELACLVDNDKDFKDNFVADLKYKDGSDNTLIMYLLETIMNSQDPKIRLRLPSIEHILPKNPSKWGLKKDEVKDFVNNIGNLTLLYGKDNKSLGNETMKVKVKKVYSKSFFSLNEALAKMERKFSENPSEAIKSRGYDLSELAAKIWKL